MSEERLIIIDGYNLIHRTATLRPGEGRTLQQSREKLVNLLSWAVGGGEAAFVVVFDGAEGMESDRRETRVDVRFSRPPRTADDVIRDLVEQEIDRNVRVTVVTADLEVARHARAMGADIALSDLFVASLLGPMAPQAPAEADSEKPLSVSKKELEEWAEIFRGRRSGQGGTPDESEND